ncbi:MAG: hypothetical protein DYH04_15320, partial [Nitrospira sp. NTP2]|nr:hypothetical protein [Nitrospira sp. NTP2]
MICDSYMTMVELDGMTAPMPFDDALLLEIILSTVDYVGECWVPQGPRLPAGYVHLKARNAQRILYVHRFVAHYFCGLNLDSTQYECHHLCHNKSCCRPTHLEALTIEEHRRRTGEEGQCLRGEQASWSMLTDAQVLQYRRRYRSGDTCPALALEAGIHRVAMLRALTGESYAHVPEAVMDIEYRRDCRGERHDRARLTEADIPTIYRAYWEGGESILALGREYNVSD